ncbi:hypothetical protein GCM10007304_10270 [Rhodococcoides trifolii]|uniref:Uncharacterized protein n=1 Tax=Rhodococcoides trifolii TaxID=908250 RepID=A0A917CU26_9NOCA|nr:hypothetical protein [Rhodococcus trifolii]GGF98226.1 hypothetical protein GCM10007304_10270 [Rhodococcus trifolii]
MLLRSRLVNSAVAFALACLVMITLHELAHAAVALLQGNSPTLGAFSVDPHATTDGERIATALGGPLFSLVSGVVVLTLPTSRLPAFWGLAVLWFGLLSVQEFSGYLITGPFAGVGDIGQALELSNAPAYVGWIGFVVGWAITYVVGRIAVRRLITFTDSDTALAPQLRELGLFAWLTGVVIVLILSLGLFDGGGDGPFEALGLIASGIFLIFVRLFMTEGMRSSGAPVRFGVPAVGMVALIVVALARQILFR